MAGIFSQGGSAGHRYAGWLSEVEAKNFQFGGKVFNGSPSAIYVGSKMVWMGLSYAAKQAILGAFGQTDGTAVIKATNAYLNQLAASGQAGKDKATALAGFINEDPMLVCSLGLEVEGVTMPIRYIVMNDAWVEAQIKNTANLSMSVDGQFKLVQASDGTCFAFGIYYAGQLNFRCYGNSSRCLAVQYGSQMLQNLDGNNYMNNDYHIEINDGKVKINGTQVTTYTKQSNALMLDFPIGVSYAQDAGSGSYEVQRRNEIVNIGTFTIGMSGVTIRQFAPFKTGKAWAAEDVSTGVAQAAGTCGMIDLVSGKFFPNANSQGSFTIPDISYTPSTP